MGNILCIILRDFCGWTSAAGITHTGIAPNPCLRMFWLIIFLACIVGCAYFCRIWPVAMYLARGTNVQRQINTEDLEFPAVTICNMNPYKKSKTDGTKIGEFLKEYSQVSMNDEQRYNAFRNKYNISDAEFNSSDNMNQRIGVMEEVSSDILVYIAADETEDTKAPLIYSVQDLIKECTYDAEDCDLQKDFEPIDDPVFGKCHVFKTDSSSSFTRPGPKYGLRMLVTVDQTENIPLTATPGVMITIDDKRHWAFPDAFGYAATVGRGTSFGMKYVRTERLGSPYHDCTNTPNDPFYYNSSYTVEACLRSCLQERIIRTCGCASARYKSPTGYNRTCDYSKRPCVNDVTTSTGSCSCLPLCEESTHQVAVSNARWPSNNFMPFECIQGSARWNGDASACHKWYETNSLFVEVYYEQVDYEVLSESPSYQLPNLLSDIGGQLGFWLGFSIITILEFFYLAILLCTYCCTSVHSRYYTGGQYNQMDGRKTINSPAVSHHSDDEVKATAM